MEGKEVEIFLKTPLFRFKYLEAGKEQQLLENAVRIAGKIIKEKELGVLVKVKDLSNQKQQPQKKKRQPSVVNRQRLKTDKP